MEAAYFTSGVVLWGVIDVSELLVRAAFFISSYLLNVVSVAAPAVLSLLKQVSYIAFYTAEELYEVS